MMDVLTGDYRELETELLITTSFEGEPAEMSARVPDTGGDLASAISTGEFTGKPSQIYVAPVVRRAHGPRRLAVAGLGLRRDLSVDRVRRAASAVVRMARQRKIPRAVFHVCPPLDGAEFLQAIAEGMTLAEFDAGQLKTAGEAAFALESAALLVDQPVRDAASKAARRGRIIGECCNMARRMINEPANTLTPSVFADRLLRITEERDIRTDILEQGDLERLGMNMLLGVGRGSSELPKMVVMRYEPQAAPASLVVGLIGKGITFDSGGISLKPALDMARMKDDMSGGAVVACAMAALAILQARVRVIGVVPIAENMPGGRAMRPGDVIRSASGKTVEVVNTDAEGRLILGDALWYARQQGATHLIDIATLTGAISVALGKITTGLFGTPAPFVELVRTTAAQAGEPCWPLPLFDDYKDQLRSDVADMINSGGRIAGAITAAIFLKEFTDSLPWIHLDIAGTAWNDEERPHLAKGPTGVGVRTLVAVAERLAEGKLDF
jgi:leucyl aminopeptidase